MSYWRRRRERERPAVLLVSGVTGFLILWGAALVALALSLKAR